MNSNTPWIVIYLGFTLITVMQTLTCAVYLIRNEFPVQHSMSRNIAIFELVMNLILLLGLHHSLNLCDR